MPQNNQQQLTDGAKKATVTVLGAGVVGLTTGCLLLAQGYDVKISSRSSPENPDADLAYTSVAAGAHWRSFAEKDDIRLQEWDEVTFWTMLKLCDVPDTGLFVAPGFEFWAEKPETWEDPWFSRFIPKYRVMNESELPPTCSWGIAYETVCINVPRYLKWLTEKFRYLGGTLKHEDTTRIEDLIDAETEVIVNCTGYGARFLGGVEDANVYPTRGQVVWVHAPQVRHTVTRLGTVHEDFTYIIPRDDGIVVLGGTYQANDDTLQPDPETSEAIIERCLSICPELKVNGKLDIVKHKAGLRPTRVGGVRCEAEWRSSGNGRRALIVHNYGHGGYGYQASYGCAQSVLAIVEAEMGGKGHHSTSIAKL